MAKNIKLTIEYDGTGLFGWQKQPDNYSVQEAIENAINKFSQEQVNLIATGRTDAGVHAKAMVANFILDYVIKTEKVVSAINFYLLTDAKLPIHGQVIIKKAELVDKSFNARFSAKQREYEYKILNSRSPTALDKNRVWHFPTKLNTVKMHEAAQFLVGTHDFSSFRDSQCQSKSPLKTLDSISVKKTGDDVFIQVSARSFLHHMVRIIVGSLTLVGTNKITPDQFKIILDKKDRTKAGVTAPAHGLYFQKVNY